MPNNNIPRREDVTAATRQLLQESLVLVHGGMAQDVGPILEMVTEKYLLRAEAEWQGRLTAMPTAPRQDGKTKGSQLTQIWRRRFDLHLSR